MSVSPSALSAFEAFDRATWSDLAPHTPLPLVESEIAQLRGLSTPLDLREVDDVYRPLSRLLSLYVEGSRELHSSTSQFLGERDATTPFVIGIAGSVAVGKSTVARLLRLLMSRWESTPRVELVTTDGFLYPNAELEARGIMDRKGFPESYDRRALLNFVLDVKSGVDAVSAPVYSHLNYDISTDEVSTVRRPDVLIVEGLNVLQPAGPEQDLALSDLFDFSIYVDAATSDITEWYVERFLALQRSAFTDPDSYFHRFATLSEAEARTTALDIWTRINLPNLEENILPTRSRARLILEKGSQHSVSGVQLRKI
ncbi:MAG TPA: type I pantothenate kinase [Microbacteriaceae bacterium]|nr:type I pantothenate kinase [Microbacteriaceae bacterium]